MIDLAESYGKGPVMMSSIAARQEVSRKYLHALLTSLKESGLVRSIRGAKGGYVLARSPEEIRVIDIFEAVEGVVAVVHCVSDPSLCNRSENCAARRMWAELSEAMYEVLRGKTLAGLVKDTPPGRDSLKAEESSDETHGGQLAG